MTESKWFFVMAMVAVVAFPLVIVAIVIGDTVGTVSRCADACAQGGRQMLSFSRSDGCKCEPVAAQVAP